MNKILKSGMMLALALFAMSCNKEDLPGNGEEVNGGVLTINVVDKGYASQDSVPETKATTDGSYKTTFGEGDEIGVYVVSSLEGNQILLNNEKLTYSSSGWTGDLRYKKIEGDSPKFFAYYPYDASVSVEKLTTSASDAEGFFEGYISSKDITNQLTAENYENADIMLSTGSLSGSALIFNMSHYMKLLVIELPPENASAAKKVGLKGSPDYNWESGLGTMEISAYKFTVGEEEYTAYEDGNKYRLLVLPTTRQVTGTYGNGTTDRTYDLSSRLPSTSGSYKTYIVDGGQYGPIVKWHDLAVGDFFMSDGSILKGSDYSSGNTIPNPGNCIGIVFSTTSPYSQDNTLDSKFTHGLVMALKDASTSAQWKTSNDVDESLTNCTTLENCRDDLSGYSNSNHIWTTYSGSLGSYPAFQKAKEYTTTLPEGKTSGWFLPSIGQWIDILANLGGKSFKEGTSESITNTSGDMYISNAAESAADKIDENLDKVGDDYVDKINYTGISIYFWPSSEYSSSSARGVLFNSSGYLYLNWHNKNNSCRVRCVLAF